MPAVGGEGVVNIPWRNHMPRGTVDAFERHRFIRGGRWYHYGTMHFDCRPQLLAGPIAPR